MDLIERSFLNSPIATSVIALLFFTGLVIIFERLYKILFLYTADSGKLMQQVQKCIMDNNLDEAVKICNSNKYAAVYQVFKAAIMNADRPIEEIQEHVEVANSKVLPELQMRVSYLYTIANVATLLGLLGTIYGLVTTFDSMAAEGLSGQEKQDMLGAGVSTALGTTAAGLLCAIPCMLTYGFLFNRINMIVDDIEHYVARLMTLLKTGSEYFDRFSPEDIVTTEQDPVQKKSSEHQEEGKKHAG